MGRNIHRLQQAASEPYDLRILQALRRIMRATDMHSRQLASEYQVTTPQLVTLRHVADRGPLTLRSLAEGVHLSSSTLVGIVDRLEKKELVARERGTEDRRQVFIAVTKKGRAFLRKAPSPLHDKLGEALAQISEREQASLAKALDRIVELMEAGDIDAAPVLHGGALHPPE